MTRRQRLRDVWLGFAISLFWVTGFIAGLSHAQEHCERRLSLSERAGRP